MAPRGVLNLMKSGKSLARAYDSNETIFPTRGPHDRYGHVYPSFHQLLDTVGGKQHGSETAAFRQKRCFKGHGRRTHENKTARSVT